MIRDTWMGIDLDALKENIYRLKAHQEGKKIIAVVKADAYGCGVIPVSKAALEAEVDMLAVSSLEEALELRDADIDSEVLVLGYVDPKWADLAQQHNITLTVTSIKWAEEAVKAGCALKVHLKYDTGMNRIGMKNREELKEALDILNKGGVRVTGIFTHFACSDEESGAFMKEQYEKFVDGLEYLDHDFEWVHCDNSDGTIRMHEDVSNAVRIGLAMYGVSDFDESLTQVASLYSRLSHVKQIEAGETVGYGATYTADKTCWIGTMPIGYADGWLRRNQGRMCFIEGQYVPLIGRICMDQCMVLLDKPYPIGTKVELFGEYISLRQVAKENDTIPYEIMTSISVRVTRTYSHDGITEDTYETFTR